MPGLKDFEGSAEIKGSRSGDYRATKLDDTKVPADLYQPEGSNASNIARHVRAKSGQADIAVVEFGRGGTATMGVAEAETIATEVLGTPDHSIIRVIVIKNGVIILDRM